MYNARDRITRGMLKTEVVLPTGNIQVCDMKMPKETPFYVSTEERRLAKEQRANRKKLMKEHRMKAREEKKAERDFAERQNVEGQEYDMPEVKAEYVFDKESAFSEEEKVQLANEMCGVKA